MKFFLPVELWMIIFTILGKDHYFMISMVSRQWRDIIFRLLKGEKLKTFIGSGVQNTDILSWSRNNNFPEEHIDIAIAGNGNIEMLKWYKMNYPEKKYYIRPIFISAAKYGKLNIMIYISENDHSYDKYKECYNDHIDDNDYDGYDGYDIYNEYNYPRTLDLEDDLYYQASKNGNLHILEWLINQEYSYNNNACIGAAEGGNLEVLKFLRNYYFPWNENVAIYAIYNNHFELLKWALNNGCEISIESWNTVSRIGNFKILKWLYDNKICEIYPNVIYDASVNGNLDIIKWAYEKGERLTDVLMDNAAFNGHLHILEWLYTNKCPWLKSVCTNAVIGGHFNILKWLRTREYKWNSKVTEHAAKRGRIDILEWAINNRCQVDTRKLCDYTALSGNLDALKWARSKGYPWNEYTTAAAASSGNLEVLKWAHENGCKWNKHTCYNAALREHKDILKWSLKNGCPIDYKKFQYFIETRCPITMINCI